MVIRYWHCLQQEINLIAQCRQKIEKTDSKIKQHAPIFAFYTIATRCQIFYILPYYRIGIINTERRSTNILRLAKRRKIKYHQRNLTIITVYLMYHIARYPCNMCLRNKIRIAVYLDMQWAGQCVYYLIFFMTVCMKGNLLPTGLLYQIMLTGSDTDADTGRSLQAGRWKQQKY